MVYNNTIRRKHEQSVADAFRRRIEKAARRQGKYFIGSSLDGQDSSLGADYIFTETTRFAMVEFKFEEGDIQSEKAKPRRLALCQALSTDNHRVSQHLACHLISWSMPAEGRPIAVNSYCQEVCNTAVWGTESKLQATSPDITTRQRDSDFIAAFLVGNLGLSYDTFNSYVYWVLNLSGDESGRIELIFEHPAEDVVGSLEFASILDLKLWLKNNMPTPSPSLPRFGL